MSKDKVTRVGVIGCGFYAQNHLHAWSDLRSEGAELVAVCDLDPEKAQSAAEHFGGNWYTDVDEMLDIENIDLLDIVTRMDNHRSLASKAAERKIAAIVQKPFAPNLAECMAIVDTARRQGAWLAVHENFRFANSMRRVKAVIASGDIGDPNWARIAFRTGFDVYSGQPYLAKEDRMSILDSGIHVLDLARWFLGEVDRLSCETQRRNPAIKGEDTATMMLRHRSGAVSIVETTYGRIVFQTSFPKLCLKLKELKDQSSSLEVNK